MERWYWIELIGFDNEAPDLGVGAFLERNVSTTGVSLLFSHLDFLFTEGELLPPTACSYSGHEYNRERRRQDWTVTQLRALVDQLHTRGIKVFLSVFDMTRVITDPAWLAFTKNGTPAHGISPIKRVGDRTVGELLLHRLALALERYDFDGLHLADGLSSARRSIENGDFSLSLCADSGIAIPEALMREEADYGERRDWILSHARVAWTRFLCDRWADFYDKLFDTVHKPILFNNAWTRDGFEALYRYGLDYRRCHAERALGVMVEENSATRSITAACDEGGVEFPLSHRAGFPYECALMQQNIRLISNGLRQISLTPISDTMEQWDALRHCPTELSRSIVRRYNNFVYRNGGFEVCSDAPMYCLSDGIPASDWQWLASQEAYRIPLPDRAEGFAAVFNPDALDAEFEQFCDERHFYGSALLQALTMGGLNLGLQLPLDEVEGFTAAKCLVVTDLCGYTEDGKRLLEQARLPLLVVGKDVSLSIPASARYDGEVVSVALYHAEEISLSLSDLSAYDLALAPYETKHGEIWTEPLSHKRVDDGFFRALGTLLNEAFAADHATDPSVKVFSFGAGEDRYLLLSNDDYTYSVCTVRVYEPIGGAEALMKYHGYAVKHDQAGFTVRIPPRGIELVRLTSPDKSKST